MKKHLLSLLVISSIFMIASCNGDKRENRNSEVQNPEALQDEIQLKRLTKRGGNLIDELYAELVEKTPELKKLETEIETFKETPSETQNGFYNYNGKSNQYYGNATGFANQITDSLSKKRILALIQKSNKKYDSESKEINDLVKQISNSQNSIQDNHNILKIVLTIPLIEKYQKENLPKKKEFLETISKQKALNKKITDKTPKY
ncbi:hypothetical protein [Flavobacterium aquicola]|uniref:Uncharacterized protein n=1 Tax=Flavobacterium aquicola TaxID=1682742 RepID=A0A3E0EJZ2_9FLAO|nr:hypothetical protein [Flavobacterium aquicola]REG98508.1 hypothetical protein C8P67_106107 [Flavobacterium aquicola]